MECLRAPNRLMEGGNDGYESCGSSDWLSSQSDSDFRVDGSESLVAT